MCSAFSLDPAAARPIFYQDPFFDLTHKRVLIASEHDLLSCLTVIPTQMRVGNAILPVAGIAGVATHPEHQRRGHAFQLISETIQALADELSYPLSGLFPYSYQYYHRLGWETASHTAQWVASPNSLPDFEESAHVRALCSADSHRVHTLYHQATHTRTGACIRDHRRWRVIEVMIPGRKIAVFEGAAGLEGYLLYEPAFASDLHAGTMIIHELHALTERACRGLIGFLAHQKGSCKRIEWNTGIEDLRHFGLLPFAIAEETSEANCGAQPSVTFKRGVMFRLIDVKRALTMAHRENYQPLLLPLETLTIQTHDPIRPQNNIPIRITQRGIETGSPEDLYRLECDICVLVQLYLGYRTPIEAVSLGLASLSNPQALSIAERLFPARYPFFADPDEF